jgi:hypothetical protein
MPTFQKRPDNTITITQVKNLNPEQLLALARKVKAGQMVPCTLTMADGGMQIVRPALQELTN